MRILFDQGVPRGLVAALYGDEVSEARALKWERISNGELLKLAENAGWVPEYPYCCSWEVVAAVNAAMPGSFAEVTIPFV